MTTVALCDGFLSRRGRAKRIAAAGGGSGSGGGGVLVVQSSVVTQKSDALVSKGCHKKQKCLGQEQRREDEIFINL